MRTTCVRAVFPVVSLVLLRVEILLTKLFSLSELVKDGQNGMVFSSSSELADQLVQLLQGFPTAHGLAALRSSFDECMAPPVEHGRSPQSDVDGFQRWCPWEENWNRILKPLLLRGVNRD